MYDMELMIYKYMRYTYVVYIYMYIYLMRCAILDQTLTNGVRMVCQNAILTS